VGYGPGVEEELENALKKAIAQAERSRHASQK